MNILSIHFGEHDSSCCVLKDGNVALYFLEERLTRLKRDILPIYSIKKCLEHFKEKIEWVVFSDTVLETHTTLLVDKLCSGGIKLNNLKTNSVSFSNYHHLSHAANAFYNSGFEESLVVVADGSGTRYKKNLSESETVYHAKYPANFECIIKNLNTEHQYFKFLNGYQGLISYEEDFTVTENTEININDTFIGVTAAYSLCAKLINEGLLEGGKIMGLSSYGTNKNYPKIFNDKNQINKDLLDYNDNLVTFKNFDIVTEVTKDNYKPYADLAYQLQIQSQEAIGNLIESAIKKTGCKKVCVSGGYGMNVVANNYYLNRFPDVDFYFEPNSDDGGLSIGAAKFIWHQDSGDMTIRKLTNNNFHGVKDPYLGKHKDSKHSTASEIANLLYKNKSVGVYAGLAECGRRALGNRSILFNALNPDAKNIVNKIKKREWYRPFAAVVLEEDAEKYFEMGRIKSSPFMTIAFKVKESAVNLIPGVTHVDNTCRIQTVSETDGYLYDLLKEFKKLSGHGILLNTSFNLSGEPLVDNIDDALITLHRSSLDYMWIEETQQLFESNNENR